MIEGLIYVEVEHPLVPGQRQWKSLPLTYRVQVAGEIVSFADLWQCWREHGHVSKSEEGIASGGDPGSGGSVAKKAGRRGRKAS